MIIVMLIGLLRSSGHPLVDCKMINFFITKVDGGPDLLKDGLMLCWLITAATATPTTTTTIATTIMGRVT